MSLARWEHLARRAFPLAREMNRLAGEAIRLAREMWTVDREGVSHDSIRTIAPISWEG